MGQLNEPYWVRIIALGCVLAIAAFGAVGLLLADLGQFKPVLWVGLGLVAFLGLGRLARPVFRPEGRASEASNVGAAAALALSLVSMLWNGLNAAKHVQINRDGALYLNAGKWIAAHGTLNLRPFVAPFTATKPFIATSTGMKQEGDHLEFALSHMLSGMLAEAHGIGGDRLMFLTVPILGGLALLVFYLLAARLLRHPFAALAATATLAFVMPQVSFSRDSTSEIPVQLLLFTAIWLLCDPRTLQHRGTGFCAGLLLGLVQAMHGDGLLFVLGLPIALAVLWMRAPGAERGGLRKGMVGCVLGLCVGLLLAAFDLVRWDRSYLSVLQGNLARLAVGLLVVTAGSIVAVRLARRPDFVESMHRRREPAAKVAGALVLLFGFGTWFVRPLVEQTHAKPNPVVKLIQQLEHLRIDPTRRYFEFSVRWISWYIGPITLVLGIIGAAALARAFVRGSLRAPPMITAAILAPPALLYIWKPSVTPDQIWASRRFLPAVFPGLILLAFGLLCAVARDRTRPALSERRFAVIALAVLAVAFPLYTIRDLSQMTEQRGLLHVVTDACHKIGPRGAVVMLAETRPKQSVAYLNQPQTLRSFCDVPVVVMVGRPQPRVLQALASKWAAKGRRLFVVAEYPQSVLRVFPNARLQYTPVAEEPHLLERSLVHRPSNYTSDPFHITATPQLTIAAVPRTPPRRGPAG